MGSVERPSAEDLEIRREQLHDLLSNHFKPAKSAADAENMFTTEQLMAIVDEHAPGLVERELLRELLLKLDFVEQFVVDGFRWLVKSR